MKILFLDIDGVLNSRKTCIAFDGYPHSFSENDMKKFDHAAIALIRKLCKVTNCKIVLSSTWRLTNSVSDVAIAFALPVIDCTPVLNGDFSTRGLEINVWLSDHHDVTTYAIVDDINDMLDSQSANFVQTNIDLGLTLSDYHKLVKILGVDK